ncbi:MAG: NADH-quinone oxidoreductase subunit G [Candidatus Tokpelaia sp.]|nr:MAG: NADH-quinone oxidoreductase subunit G [Candidatus Tokpelaia sp.]KAA6207514.1 MAG: NADH-quinone oxidoreductase subunit G [Candidatus Tokpelaia sp.]
MARIIVDSKEIEVPDSYTLLQAAEAAGAVIPRFCFHERLSVPGNCRMCLVEVKGGPPKPVSSCSMGVRDLRPGANGEPPEIFTNTPMVKKAREGALEFLLINHPLDCPICDQGGECDLQDQAMAFGRSSSRYAEDKRAVEDKYIGPLIKTVMTRCIHCTRCVRFTAEIAGSDEIGLTGRGEDAEITTYLQRALTSELQGNIIDLCPVGALTARPYAFHARPWELTKTETVDVMDAMGCAIRVDTRGREVMRILPRVNEAINEEWISDKTRFVWDGLRRQRLDRPYLRQARGRLVETGWAEAFAAIRQAVSKAEKGSIGAIAGDMATVEEMYALKALLAALGSDNVDCRQDNTALHGQFGRASYIFNPTIAGIDESDALLIIGSNPRLEAAVLNARIRKRSLKSGDYPIGLIGAREDLRYPYTYLGAGRESLKALAAGESSFFHLLKKAQKPLIIIGQAALCDHDGEEILRLIAQIARDTAALRADWNGFAVLHRAAARVGGLDIGFTPPGGKKAADIIASSDILFLLGADEADLSAKKGFTVYIGSHGDKGAHAADVILPAAAYTEKSGIYVNMEGRVQMAARANFAPGEAREDWAIIRALSAVLGQVLPFDSLSALRKNLFADYPHLAGIDKILPGKAADIIALGDKIGVIKGQAFPPAVQDFYLTNPIARASAVMAECSALAHQRRLAGSKIEKTGYRHV